MGPPNIVPPHFREPPNVFWGVVLFGLVVMACVFFWVCV